MSAWKLAVLDRAPCWSSLSNLLQDPVEFFTVNQATRRADIDLQWELEACRPTVAVVHRGRRASDGRLGACDVREKYLQQAENG